MRGLLHDLRFAPRALLQRRGFTLVAVATLALGIAANTAVFSVNYGIFLAPLPFPAPERLVALYSTDRISGTGRQGASHPDFVDWQREAAPVVTLAAYRGDSVNLTDGDEPVRAVVTRATASLFEVLATPPILGRTFTEQEEVSGAAEVAVLDHGFWVRRLAADPDVVGRELVLDGRPHRVIGVMPPEFELDFATTDLWLPLVVEPGSARRDARGLAVIGRLRPGLTIDAAASDLQASAARLEAAYPLSNDGIGVAVEPLDDIMPEQAEMASFINQLMAAFVLLVACANLAGLQLARAAGRTRELAVRAALGATRGRIARQLLTENALVVLAGGALALVLTRPMIAALVGAFPPDVPGLSRVGLESAGLAYAAVSTVLTLLVFGLLPTRASLRGDLVDHLRGAGAGEHRGSRLRMLLTVGQVAVALVMMTGAGLALQSFHTLNETDLGLQPEGRLTFRLALPANQYASDADVRAFHDRLRARLTVLPGVAAVGVTSNLPLDGYAVRTRLVAEGNGGDESSPSSADELRVDGPYFGALGIELARGRGFVSGDRFGGAREAIVNEVLARRLWGDEDPLGRRVAPGMEPPDDEQGWWTVVGVARHNYHFPPIVFPEPRAQLFLDLQAEPRREVTLVLQGGDAPAALAEAARVAVRELDPALPVFDVRPMAQVIDQTPGGAANWRGFTATLSAFTGVALVLALMGIYGVVAHGVAARTREIGVRLALGATGARVVGEVVREGVRLAAGGVLVGTLGAVALWRVMASLMPGLGAVYLVTIPGVALLLAITAAGACWLPARRAASVSPLVALRDS